MGTLHTLVRLWGRFPTVGSTDVPSSARVSSHTVWFVLGAKVKFSFVVRSFSNYRSLSTYKFGETNFLTSRGGKGVKLLGNSTPIAFGGSKTQWHFRTFNVSLETCVFLYFLGKLETQKRGRSLHHCDYNSLAVNYWYYWYIIMYFPWKKLWEHKSLKYHTFSIEW